MISIITTALNSAKTLEHTIQTVINQTYKNIEFIIIDGGSQDGTVDIIKKYSSHITCWESEKDNCVSEAVNKGIRKANGDIVFNLPSDDFIEPDFCEKMAACFKQGGDDVDFVYGDIIMCDETGNALYKIIAQRISLFGVKKSVYDELGCYDEKMRLNNDVDFLQRMDDAGKKGVYCEIARWMRMGGATQNNFVEWMRSLKRLELMRGESRVRVQIRFLYRFFLYSFEALIRRLFGLKGFVWFLLLKARIKRFFGMKVCYAKMDAGRE